MTFKRMMALGAVAAALAFTGCQDRSRTEQDLGAGDQTQPATGGSGAVDSTIPGGSGTIGGTEQDDAQQGTELGGTGSESDMGSGGSGMNQQDNAGSLDHGGSGTVHQPGTGDSLNHGGTGGSGTDMGTSGDLDQNNMDQNNMDQNNMDQRNQLDDQDNVGGTDDAAR